MTPAHRAALMMTVLGGGGGEAVPTFPVANSFYFQTTSTSATFTPTTVTKSGGTLTWKVYDTSEVELLSQTANKPTFNLSAAPGTKWVVATSPDGWSGLTVFTATSKNLVSINPRAATALVTLSLGSNQLTTLDVSQNVNLTSLLLAGNSLTALDVSTCVALITLRVSTNNLAAPPVGLAGLIALLSFEAFSCNYSAAQINAILAACITNEANGNPARDPTIDISNNAAPTGQGLIDKDALTTAGWTVGTD